MCSPTAAFAVMGGMQVLSGLQSSQASVAQGESKQRYYNYLAAQNDSEANLGLVQGAQTVTSIQDQASAGLNLEKRSQKQFEGSQRAAMGASGSAGSVTAEDIVKNTATTENLDETALRYNADVKSWETSTAASDRARALREQANSYRLAGANEAEAGVLNGQASLLGSATNAAGTWYNWSRTGGGNTPGTIKVKSRPTSGYPIAPDYGNS